MLIVDRRGVPQHLTEVGSLYISVSDYVKSCRTVTDCSQGRERFQGKKVSLEQPWCKTPGRRSCLRRNKGLGPDDQETGTSDCGMSLPRAGVGVRPGL